MYLQRMVQVAAIVIYNNNFELVPKNVTFIVSRKMQQITHKITGFFAESRLEEF